MRRECALLLAFAGLLGGCSGPDGVNDPFEAVNRKVFAFNHTLDKHTALPAAKFYSRAVPSPTRDGIHNFFSNLTIPVTFANDLLQGSFGRAGESICRFAVNTTWGILGVFDRASEVGCPDHDEDFGQTLGYYGMPGGPYMVLPLTGPELPRDIVGRGFVDHYFSPLGYVTYGGKYYVSLGVSALKTVDGRARSIREIEAVERDSIDTYAAMRDQYLRRREAEISNDSPRKPNSTAADTEQPPRE